MEEESIMRSETEAEGKTELVDEIRGEIQLMFWTFFLQLLILRLFNSRRYQMSVVALQEHWAWLKGFGHFW